MPGPERRAGPVQRERDASQGRWTMLGGTNHPHAGEPQTAPWGGKALLWTGIPGRPDSAAYQSYLIAHAVGHDGRIHIAWAFNANNPQCWDVNDLGYAVSADKGETWCGADGRPFDRLPMTDTNYDVVVHDMNNVWYQIPFVHVGKDGRPCVSAKNDTQHVAQWWRPVGGKWVMSNMGSGSYRVLADGYGRVYTFGWDDKLYMTTDSGATFTSIPATGRSGNVIPDYDYLYSTANIRYVNFANASAKQVYTITFPGRVWKTAAQARPESLRFDGRAGGRDVGSVTALAWDLDFCFENGTLYVYSAAGRPSERWTRPGVAAVF